LPKPLHQCDGEARVDARHLIFAYAIKLPVNLIEEHSGKFEPRKMPNEYARAAHELVQAKIEQPSKPKSARRTRPRIG